MLHVFYVHSQTCYVAAMRIIEFNVIDREKVIIFISRNTPKIDAVLSHVYIQPVLDNWMFYSLRNILDFRWLHTRRVIDIFDSIIERHVGNEFIFYSQNGRHYKYNVIISSRLCVGNNYFEDGLDNYSSQDVFNTKYPVPLKNRYRLVNFVLGSLQRVRERVHQNREVFWKGKNDSVFYALHPLSMTKIKLHIPKIVLNETYVNLDLPLLSDMPIVLPSALDEQNISVNKMNIKVYTDYLCSSKVEAVYIKWHPAQKESTKRMYRSSFETCGIEIREIDPSVPMELYFTKTESAHTILSIGSSLLLYAALLNRNNVSIVLYNNLHSLIGKKTPRSQYWEETFNLFNLDNLKVIN